MHANVVNRWSLSRVVVQDLRDEIASCIRDADVVRESISVHTDSLVSRLDVGSLKGRLTNDECVNDDSDRPNIDLVGMTLLTLEHFGSDVVWCTTDSTLPLTIELELRGQTKITNLNLHLVVKEQVTELQVSMDDTMTVQVLDGSADLVNVALNFEFV